MDKLNVIIPVYNPCCGWEEHFASSVSALEKNFTGIELRIILVNDGSTINLDNISRITDSIKCLKYCSYPRNRGKGYAIRYGLNFSEADYYIYTDVDFPFGCEVIPEMYRIFKMGRSNIIIGTRDSSYFRMLPPGRRFYSRLLTKLNHIITGFRIKDTQAGLKGTDNKGREVLLNTKTDTFLFELEFLRNSIKKGLTYELIDISCRPGIKLTNFRFKVLVRETIILFKILLG